MLIKEIIIIILASAILGLSLAFPNTSEIFSALIYMAIIIVVNVLAKKVWAYYYEANTEFKFWSWYHFGFRRDSHFKEPLPMFWLPLAFSLITKGLFFWPAILEFDITPRTERVSRRHGLYRFTEMAETHVAEIAIAGIVANMILAILAYILGFATLGKLSVYYLLFSLIPLGSLDGSKIFFGSRYLWITFVVIALIFAFFAFIPA